MISKRLNSIIENVLNKYINHSNINESTKNYQKPIFKRKDLKNVVYECVYLYLNETKNNLKTVPLTQDLIVEYKNDSNWLNHLQLDADGIAYMDGNNLVGYVGYKGSWIIGVWVKPSYRKEGLGSKLLNYAVSHGAYRSSVNKQNINSLNFHEKNGFKIYKFDTVMYYLRKDKK